VFIELQQLKHHVPSQMHQLYHAESDADLNHA
jgi:hypothetical protein